MKKNRKGLRGLVFSFVLIAMLFNGTTNVLAEENTKEEKEETGNGLPEYIITPILPSNQEEGREGWFSLNITGGKIDQEIEYEIKNNTDQELEITTKALNALTSPNKVIQYIETAEDNKSALTEETYALADIVEVPKSITLEPKEIKNLKVKIKGENIKGQLLGAISFQKVEEDEVVENVDEDVPIQIKNEQRTVMGLQINNQDDKIKNNLEVGNVYLETMPSYYSLYLPIKNTEAKILKDGLLEYKVEDKKGKILFETEQGENIDFAPKSKTDISIPWTADKIENTTEYKITGKITIADDVFPFESSFKTDFGEKEMNESGSYSLPKIGSNGFNMYFLLIPLFILILSIYYVTTRYVVFSNNEEISNKIQPGHPTFGQIDPLLKAKNQNKYHYKHTFKRKKKYKTEHYYLLTGTKRVKK